MGKRGKNGFADGPLTQKEWRMSLLEVDLNRIRVSSHENGYSAKPPWWSFSWWSVKDGTKGSGKRGVTFGLFVYPSQTNSTRFWAPRPSSLPWAILPSLSFMALKVSPGERHDEIDSSSSNWPTLDTLLTLWSCWFHVSNSGGEGIF